MAQPGGHARLFHGKAPGGALGQSRSWEVKQRAISGRLAGLLCPSTVHLGSGQGLGPGKKKTGEDPDGN